MEISYFLNYEDSLIMTTFVCFSNSGGDSPPSPPMKTHYSLWYTTDL